MRKQPCPDCHSRSQHPSGSRISCVRADGALTSNAAQSRDARQTLTLAIVHISNCPFDVGPDGGDLKLSSSVLHCEWGRKSRDGLPSLSAYGHARGRAFCGPAPSMKVCRAAAWVSRPLGRPRPANTSWPCATRPKSTGKPSRRQASARRLSRKLALCLGTSLPPRPGSSKGSRRSARRVASA